jgi:hypothetical protein
MLASNISSSIQVDRPPSIHPSPCHRNSYPKRKCLSLVCFSCNCSRHSYRHTVVSTPFFSLIVPLNLSLSLSLSLGHRFQYTPFYYVYRAFVQLSHCWNHHKKNSATGKVSGFDILRRGDPLRAEMAPYTGDYFQYLLSEFEKQQCLTRFSGFFRKIIRLDLLCDFARLLSAHISSLDLI